MKNKGWIKLYRKFQDWEWYDDINTRVVFLHCLLKANHKDQKYRGTVIPKGSFLTGRSKFAEEVGLSVQQVRTAFQHLKLTNEITIKTTKKGTHIFIVQWGEYQEKGTELTSESTNKPTNNQPTVNQQLTTNKNDKNIKNENNTRNSKANLEAEARELLRIWNRIYGKNRGSIKPFFGLYKKWRTGDDAYSFEDIKQAVTMMKEHPWINTKPDFDLTNFLRTNQSWIDKCKELYREKQYRKKKKQYTKQAEQSVLKGWAESAYEKI